MIKLEKIDVKEGKIVIFSNEPIRLEIDKLNGGYCIHGYTGIEVDMEQEATFLYDSEFEIDENNPNETIVIR